LYFCSRLVWQQKQAPGENLKVEETRIIIMRKLMSGRTIIVEKKAKRSEAKQL
jgi:hypothetical protein